MKLVSRHRLLLFLKGMAMGAADSVPGVSGGTIALITNIYEELVDAIKGIGWHVLVVWKQAGFRAAWQYMNGDFLVTLLAGILCSLVLLGHVIISMMESYLPYMLAFFAGLVLASIRFVAYNISAWNLKKIIMAAMGIILALILISLPVREGGESLGYYFFCGAIAVCAMILPGISGAFVLVLLGGYIPLFQALSDLNFVVLATYFAGCLTGLIFFSHFLSWLLHHYHDQTMATLTGMLAGSLYMLWPWQLVTEMTLEGYSVSRYAPVMPGNYAAVTGLSFSPALCLGLTVAGIVLVLLLEYAAGNLKINASDRA